MDRPVAKLSGGQRSQVGLAMALAKQPRLLLLDEPVAALDPLARVDFLTTLTQAVADAEGALTVVMSSHLLSDLERVCDHVVLLAAGKTQLCGAIDDVLGAHKLLVGSSSLSPPDEHCQVIKETRTDTTVHLLVKVDDATLVPPDWHVRDVDMEQIVLAYMARPGAGGTR